MAGPVSVPAQQPPFRPDPGSVQTLERFQIGIQEGIEKLQGLHSKREALKPTLEKEAEDLRKLKELSRGDPSILENWKIRNRSKKFRILAEEDQVMSQAMHQEWKIIREYAKAVARNLRAVIHGVIQKIERDLLVHGNMLKEDRDNFFAWAGQHSQYQELSTFISLPSIGSWLDIYLSSDWQGRLLDEGFADRMIIRWKNNYSQRIKNKEDELKILEKELRLRRRSDKIRSRTGGNLGQPLLDDERPLTGLVTDEGNRDAATLEHMMGMAQRNIEMTKNGLAVLGILNKPLSEF